MQGDIKRKTDTIQKQVDQMGHCKNLKWLKPTLRQAKRIIIYCEEIIRISSSDQRLFVILSIISVIKRGNNNQLIYIADITHSVFP